MRASDAGLSLSTIDLALGQKKYVLWPTGTTVRIRTKNMKKKIFFYPHLEPEECVSDH